MREELLTIGYVVLRGHRLVIPKVMREQCVKLAHQGHQGIIKTKQRLRTKVWWPQMEKDVEKFVKTCHSCQLVSAPNPPEPIKPTQLPNGPWEDISIDFLGPLESGHYVLVVIDYYSRYFEVEITKDTTSQKVIASLTRMFTTHGLPKSLTSDNAPNFKSKEFEDFLTNNGIKHRLVTPLHPAANGEVERQNRSLMKRIRIAKAESKDWKREIQEYLFAYRTTPHSVTGLTPAEMMFGRKLRTKLPELDCKSEDEEVRDRDNLNKYKNKQYLDSRRRAQNSDLAVGDTVLLKQSVRNKMDTPFYNEPFQLISKDGNSCTVKSPEGLIYKRNSTFLKKYNLRNETENVTSPPEIITPPKNIPFEKGEEETITTQYKVNENAYDDKSNETGNDNIDDIFLSNYHQATSSNNSNSDGRPVRIKTVPSKYKDFVMCK